jgi:hypothetical protein
MTQNPAVDIASLSHRTVRKIERIAGAIKLVEVSS